MSSHCFVAGGHIGYSKIVTSGALRKSHSFCSQMSNPACFIEEQCQFIYCISSIKWKIKISGTHRGLLSAIWVLGSSMVTASVSPEIRRLRVRFPSGAQKHFSEFAINLSFSRKQLYFTFIHHFYGKQFCHSIFGTYIHMLTLTTCCIFCLQ